MLNWDEYGKEENTTPPAAPEIKTQAVTQEVAAEQSQPPQPAENAVSTESSTSNIGEGSRAEAARIAVNNLDETAGHEELCLLYTSDAADD